MTSLPDPVARPICRDCGTDDPALHYRSGRMTRCYDCQNFWNLTHKKRGGGVDFDLEAFLAWKRGSDERRRCRYCGIDADSLHRLEIVRAGRRCENIGVDRIDNAAPYRLDNLAPCCPLCNGVKSDFLSAPEMLELGRTLRLFWRRRLELVEAASPAPSEALEPTTLAA